MLTHVDGRAVCNGLLVAHKRSLLVDPSEFVMGRASTQLAEGVLDSGSGAVLVGVSATLQKGWLLEQLTPAVISGVTITQYQKLPALPPTADGHRNGARCSMSTSARSVGFCSAMWCPLSMGRPRTSVAQGRQTSSGLP